MKIMGFQEKQYRQCQLHSGLFQSDIPFYPNLNVLISYKNKNVIPQNPTWDTACAYETI